MKSGKKIFFLFFGLILIFTISSLKTKTAFASSPIDLPLNASVSGYITDSDDQQIYAIHLSNAGRVTVKLDSYIGGVNIALEDSEGKEVFQNYVYGGNSADPAKWSNWKDLEAGTYYVKVDQEGSYTGKYDLKVNYDAIGNNEIEPNDGTAQAQLIKLNSQTVTGLISWNDSKDVYKVVLPKAGRVTVKLDSYIGGVNIALEDSEGKEVFQNYVYGGNSADPAKWSDWKDLKAGTYYVKVGQESDYTGKYTLVVQCPDLLPAPPTVNMVSNKSKTVTGKTVPNGTVSVKINSKVYTGKSDSKGYFSIPIPVQSNGTKLYVSVKDKMGYTSNEKVVVVVDKIPPAAPSVNTISSKSTTITGKAEPNSTVIAYVGSQTIGSAKTDKYGRYVMRITPKKTGTSIKVIAMDGSRNRSAERIVKVK